MQTSSERRFLCWIEFQGTDFLGFARQGGKRTVASELDAAWFRWRGERIKVRSSSRTDAGVHARRMPIFIRTREKLPAKAVMHGLNAELPDDVALQHAERVDDDFHVRHDAIGKRYVYRIWNARLRSPLRRFDHWLIHRPIDVDAMVAAAPHFVGSHDFSAFRAAGCQSKSTRRAIREVSVRRDGPLIEVTVRGNAFLRHMVRIMVGTLGEVGGGRIDGADLPAIMASADRVQAGQTAPGCGLTLEDVYYGEFGGKEGLNFKRLDGQWTRLDAVFEVDAADEADEADPG